MAAAQTASPSPFPSARVARRIRVASLAGPPQRGASTRFDPEQHYLETALRSKSARSVRAGVRRMEPVFLRTPRWSRPQTFLEEIALDLAVGDPAIGCRTVGCRPLAKRTAGEAWAFILQLFGELGRGAGLADGSATAADRKGFRWGLEQVLEDAHHSSRHRLAVMMHGIEHVPVEALTDLVDQWRSYCERHPEGARIALVLAAAERPRWLDLPGLRQVDLQDFSEAETIATLVQRCGPLPPKQLRMLAGFTGGVPEVVDAVAAALAARGSKRVDAESLTLALGQVGVEMRGALDIIAARGELSDRLQMLAEGRARPEWLDTDSPLMKAGLIKRVRHHGLPHVALRAGAFATMMG